jgi:hypothetical protein
MKVSIASLIEIEAKDILSMKLGVNQFEAGEKRNVIKKSRKNFQHAICIQHGSMNGWWPTSFIIRNWSRKLSSRLVFVPKTKHVLRSHPRKHIGVEQVQK